MKKTNLGLSAVEQAVLNKLIDPLRLIPKAIPPKRIDPNDYVLVPKAMIILLQHCLQRDIDERGTRTEILEELNKSIVAYEDTGVDMRKGE